MKMDREQPGVSNRFLALCVGALLGFLSGLLLGYIHWLAYLGMKEAS
ncbi:MAG: hypothetical protein HY730_09525 [Candidatus Tectomicrobia bacterium]|uniref:Uncharacterized protein n=1 Tax=Tectimicrobiota bacterium TaxID=2528274 RepID=A0A933LQX0_UNCTE|nr:hypothetical protein [Candidatus Tectomicrobia bacterium]